ncbi:MAG TPA: heme exporter protein CcmD [Gammaproteobacteria bacterium]|jgi:heme exporter protein D|nr:heme exporter protein CcmD [Gammaproteobacteria bacterium]
MQDFFHMGGYAFFVWSAYTVVLVVLTANFISPMRRRRRLLREISQQSSRKIINDAETQT